MKRFKKNYLFKKYMREYREVERIAYQREFHVTSDLVSRIGLEAELEGHSGCVNCLEWNEKGSLLASGSDDVQVIVWDPFKHKPVTSIRTGHQGNIFSVKFLPSSNDGIIASGAADFRVRVHDINTKETTHVFSCHRGRVKRLATAPNVPFMFWSAAEDGTIMQFDLRNPESCNSANPKNVLINLNAHLGSSAEAKCIAINPLRPEQLAVGANDPFVRIYDRRMLTCKSIKFSNDNGHRLPWERPLLDPDTTAQEDYQLPSGCASYYVAGHLPQKQHDYKKKYRTLATTYLTFSPDGRELLVNLGGEQIYLFDVNKGRVPQKFDLPLHWNTNGVVLEASCSHSNGYTKGHHGTTNGVTVTIPTSSRGASGDILSCQKKRPPLPAAADALKNQANAVFEKQKYSQAILLYNKALTLAPDSPVLYGNRAAAYMKRAWDGDLYAALRDCHSAILLDNNHLKAHFRLARCLYGLQWTKEAFECLNYFKNKFPDFAKSNACESLERDIKAAIFSRPDPDTDDNEKDSEDGGQRPPSHRTLSDQEREFRRQAYDYEARFCGHCNTTTDIKEANFFGSNGQYIVAGSDDGSFFVWEKATTNIVRVLRGDDSIVNCLQPHPSYCMLATSGIDPVVRLWNPKPQDGTKDDREVDNSDDAASANQKRMNADPLEVMLMNMGYRLTGVLDGEEEEEREAPVQCRPS